LDLNRAIGKLAGKKEAELTVSPSHPSSFLPTTLRLGFGVFLNQGNIEAESYFEYNEYLPDQIQINLDYAGKEIKQAPANIQVVNSRGFIRSSGIRLEQ
jgi:hypothetical protein